MKHSTRGRHQLKMAAPAEVSKKKRSNFRIRQFKEKFYFNIVANLTLNTMVSFIIHLIARTARIACPDRHTHRHTHTQDNYCNPRCACTPRVNKCQCVSLESSTGHTVDTNLNLVGEKIPFVGRVPINTLGGTIQFPSMQQLAKDHTLKKNN